MSKSSQARVFTSDEVNKGVAPAAFGISIFFILVIVAALVVFMILYFRKNAALIKPSQCPDKVSGLLVNADVTVTQVASNCGTQADCTFQTGSVKDAVTICENLGPAKCASFSLSQIQNSDLYTMKVSDATTTSVSVGTDTYRILD